MYQSGASIADIKAAAGTTDIYTLLRNAGVEPGRSPRRRGRILAMAKQEAADALVAAASDLDGSDSLTLADYTNWHKNNAAVAPPVHRITRLFGSWKTAVHQAGLRAGSDPAPIAVADAANWLRQAATDLGATTMSQARFDAWRMSSNVDNVLCSGTIAKRIGWAETLQAAGLTRPSPKPRTPKHPIGWTKYNDDELIDALRDAALEHPNLSRRLYQQWQVNNPGRPSANTILKQLGWTEARQRIGLPRSKPPRRITNTDLITALEAAEAEIGAPLTKAVYRRWATNNKQPSLSTVQTYLDWDTRQPLSDG